MNTPNKCPKCGRGEYALKAAMTRTADGGKRFVIYCSICGTVVIGLGNEYVRVGNWIGYDRGCVWAGLSKSGQIRG